MKFVKAQRGSDTRIRASLPQLDSTTTLKRMQVLADIDRELLVFVESDLDLTDLMTVGHSFKDSG